MFRGSIATPSLEAAIINAKYVNSNPLDRISRDFQANGLNLSKQTMSNWTVWTAERYLSPVCDLMRKRQLEAHVNQSDETPVDVIHDGRPAGSKSYMWVHITGELSPVPPIIVYEYQKTRHSDHPKAYYKDFDGVLMTDGLEQYHKLERDLTGVKMRTAWPTQDVTLQMRLRRSEKALPKQSSHPLRIKHLYESVLFMIWKEL